MSPSSRFPGWFRRIDRAGAEWPSDLNAETESRLSRTPDDMGNCDCEGENPASAERPWPIEGGEDEGMEPAHRRQQRFGSSIDPRHGERGIAMVFAMFLTIMVLGIVLSGVTVMESSQKKTNTTFLRLGQARQFAEAGLTDGLAWFRRQTSQPVTVFDPKLDKGAVPPILDTDDPSIGIVREFEIGHGIYGRYEVRKYEPGQSPLEPEVKDISEERGAVTPGTVWRLVSRSFVFRRVDATKPFNESPNHVLAIDVLETEIRRLTLAPPAQAALCSQRGDGVTLGAKGRILGGTGAGIAYGSGTGSPSISGEISGMPPVASISGYDDSVPAVFGVDREQLRSLADDRIGQNEAFPSVIPTNYLLFCETDLVFDASRPLKGTGIVYVEGNVTIEAGSNSFFNGLLYVTGNLVVKAPSLLRGTIIIRGSTSFSGLGDYSELEFDDGVLNSLMVEVGQYRIGGAVRPPLLRGSRSD